MEYKRKQLIRRLIGVAKLVVFALLCVFIYHAFISGNQQLSGHTWHAEPRWLIVAGLLYLLGSLPQAIFWKLILERTGQHVHWAEAVRAHYISQLGKYVPGKWMVILLRRTLLFSPDVEHTVVAASVFFETLTSLAVASAMAAVVLLIWHPSQTLLIATAVGSIFLLGMPTVPVIFEWLIRVLGVSKLNPTAGARFRRIGPRTLIFGWAILAIGWLIQGLSLWATLRAMDATTGGPLDNLSLHTTAVSLSVVAGFLSQIPGGLAVREWVSAQLIEPVYGPSVAIVSAIVYRLVLLVSELAISTILYLVGLLRRRRPAAQPAAEATPAAPVEITSR